MTSNKGDKTLHTAAAANEIVPPATAEQGVRPEQAKHETGRECKPRVVMRPELLRAALHADCQRLRHRLDGTDGLLPAATTTTGGQQDDVVVLDVVRSSSPSTTAGRGAGTGTSSLLEGTTFQGDSALHVVATSGEDDNFLESATMIYGKAKNLLEATNNNGDTPLHCAARADSVKMVSHLLKLWRSTGGGQGAPEERKPAA
ncbi:hypothetical protein E2562_027586 [Oryza meyeriana var. granulata]|uniref:Uncharacterized protein n=1 Tax=Oryza meyeriana var. granulata TaxID=110450 RepID=A0A6G1DNG6_9ORYZ|nr:hypothetical protein E2562_027586 [Oryza meyeriana var. granulata]